MSGEKVVPDFLNMSDEDLVNFDPTTLNTPVADAPVVVEEVEVLDAATPALIAEGEDDDADPDMGEGAAEALDGAGEAAAAIEDKAPELNSDPADKKEAPQKPELPKEPTPAEVVVEAVDYKAEYERMIAPFKANGRDIAVKSVDDAIALMQMGANYNKKMAALKPNLKLMKLLENNGLLSEEKLSFLIDLEKKSPEAISKLVKDSGIDPLDLDAEKASAYKPKTYAVDDREMELDTVLDELQGSQAYNRTLDIVSNKWDGASKQVIATTPQLLKVINGHVESGIYDLISKEIESERVFGRLKGLSDIEAYRQVGDAIQARGGFNHLGQGSAPTPGQPSAAPVVVPPKPKVDEDKLRDKRRAASSTKPAGPSVAPQGFNPLALSDEEFSKVGINKFL